MKVKIVNEKHNPYLKRKEIDAEVEHDNEPSPSKEALQHYIAKERKTDADKIEVKEIMTETGLPKSKAKVFVWEEPVKKKEKKIEEKKSE